MASSTLEITVRCLETGDVPACEAILRGLPGWFGIPEANDAYVHDMTELPGFVATTCDEIAGVVLLKRHTDVSAEVHFMAVREDLHRKGAGRALLERTVSDLTSAGLRLLMVKTLAPSDPDEGYRKTRAFYTSMGFLPLEETQEWGPENPCLVMVKVLEASDGR